MNSRASAEKRLRQKEEAASQLKNKKYDFYPQYTFIVLILLILIVTLLSRPELSLIKLLFGLLLLGTTGHLTHIVFSEDETFDFFERIVVSFSFGLVIVPAILFAVSILGFAVDFASSAIAIILYCLVLDGYLLLSKGVVLSELDPYG